MSGHLLVGILVCSLACEPQEARIWDGDSFILSSDQGREKIRLANIDAPEIDGRCAAERELAQMAKRRLAAVVSGTTIRIVREGHDRYGRTLALVTADGRDAGDVLVTEGLASPWTGHREPWC